MNTVEHFNIQRTIDKLIFDFSVDPEVIYEGLNRSNHSRSSYSARELVQLASNLEVNAVDLSSGKLYVEHVARSLNSGYRDVEPSHFLDCAFSSTTSLSTLLSEAEKFGRRDYLLKKLQVHERYLDSHKPLSVMACREALEEMKPFFTKRVVQAIGRDNARKFCAGQFGQAMKFQYSILDSLESFIYHSELIEKNWTYKVVKKGLSSFVLESRESELMSSHLSGKYFTTTQLNIWRWAFLEEVLKQKTGFNISCQQINSKNQKALVEIGYA